MNKYALSFKSTAEIIKYIDEQEIQFIDLNFTDIRGKWQHTTQHASAFTKDLIDNGTSFDNSSIHGWDDIQKSNMIIKPDISRATYDPFAAQKTIKIFCDIHDTISGKPHDRDPRSIAKAAESYLKKSKLGDTSYFGPEPEFFIFDDVRVQTQNNHVSYIVDSEEGDYNRGRDYPTGNMGHRPTIKSGYLSESPVDSLSDIRAEMLSVIESMGVGVENHHHEVAPSQCELGIKFASLLESADNIQLYKHAVHNVAHSYGKSATFMPKPINGDNGSGMHVHQSLWKSGKPLFAGKGYANLSETALYYIGGILKHARTLNAFTNPTTNSYKRIVSGGEVPASLTYSASNRSAACRIPNTNTPKEQRIEIRFPDSMANPYLAFSAMLMAGIDGIENKIHPGDSSENGSHLPSDEDHSHHQHICVSLKDALQALNSDHEFLLKGDVFTRDIIDSFIKLKTQEIQKYEGMTHPIEVDMYYSS